jgi:hypothetical protein
LITRRDASGRFAAPAIKPPVGNLQTKHPQENHFQKVNLSSR